jgi:NAD(P)-dependent dehydrogenase (short-subunit alcohol dehydrogenase family)
MDINGSIALVTGANRGLGRAFTQRLLERGAAKVYAAARRPETTDLPGVVPLRLDVTDPGQIAAAAERAADATLLVNNAGMRSGERLLDGDLGAIRTEVETHLFGPLQLTRALAPHLARNGGGAVLNVLSAMSWFGIDGLNGYYIAKAAEWALTNGLRLELACQGTQVTGVHIGVIDTDMSADWPGDKLAPLDVADIALDGIQAGAAEILADDWSRTIKAYLADDPATAYPRIAAALATMAGLDDSRVA